MQPSRQAHTQGTAIMMVLVLIWGSFLPVSKVALAVIDPYWLSSLRFGAAGLVFLLMLRGHEGCLSVTWDRQLARAAVFGSLGFAAFGISLFEGLRLTRPEIGAMILAIGPVLTVIFQWWQSGRRPDRFTLGAIALALSGEALVITAGDLARLSGGDMLGNALMFLAAIFWTAYTLGGQQFPDWSPMRYSATTCISGWLAILVATALTTALGHSHAPSLDGMASVWPQLLFIILVVSVFGILLWNTAVAKIGPLSAGLIGNFAPVITYLIALAQGRIPAPLELVGVGLVLLALVANNRHQRRLHPVATP